MKKSDKNFLNFNNEFQQLHSLKVNDKIIIRSHSVSYAPKYSYPIVWGDYVERDSKIIYKRVPRKGGCWVIKLWNTHTCMRCSWWLCLGSCHTNLNNWWDANRYLWHEPRQRCIYYCDNIFVVRHPKQHPTHKPSILDLVYFLSLKMIQNI